MKRRGILGLGAGGERGAETRRPEAVDCRVGEEERRGSGAKKRRPWEGRRRVCGWRVRSRVFADAEEEACDVEGGEEGLA